MIRRRSRFRLVALALAAASCASPEPAPPRPLPPTAARTQTTVAPAAPGSAAPAPPPPPSATAGDDDEAPNNYAGALDATTTAAPCDYDRPYRGRIGEASVSIALARDGSKLKGFAAYDAGVGELDVAGSIEADGSLRIVERKDGRDLGTMLAKCEPSTGIIEGTWTQGANTRPFRIAPRAKGSASLVERRKQVGKLVEGEVSCTWDVRSPAVFGLRDSDKTGRINAALQVRFPDEARLFKEVSQCPPRGDNHVTGWYSIEMDEGGVLGVLQNGYVYFGPAVHGDWNAGADALSIDLPSGRKLALKDVVTSAAALRPVVHACVPFASTKLEFNDWELERTLQGWPAEEGEASTVHEPSFLVLPDGIAILIRNMPTVGAWLELQGPVIRWGALARAGVLAPKSPIARLWSGQKPLPDGEAPCARMFVPKWLPPKKA